MPLYSQGYSVARYLDCQRRQAEVFGLLGRRHARRELVAGRQASYGYADLAVLQETWLDWVQARQPGTRSHAGRRDRRAWPRSIAARRPAPNLIYRGQSGPPNFTPAGSPADADLNADRPDAAPADARPAIGRPTASTPARPTRRSRWLARAGSRAGPARRRRLSRRGQFAAAIGWLRAGAVGSDTGHEMTRPQPAAAGAADHPGMEQGAVRQHAAGTPQPPLPGRAASRHVAGGRCIGGRAACEQHADGRRQHQRLRRGR